MIGSSLVIEGGRKLEGEVKLAGAKNAALPILVAACLGHEPSKIENVPVGLRDISVMLQLLKSMGAAVAVEGSTVIISRGDLNCRNIPLDSAQKIRSSLLLIGLFLGLGMDVCLPQSGGCNIGERKYDLHLMGLRKLGAEIDESADGIQGTARKLKGDIVEFYLPTTTGTQNVILGAIFAQGETIIKNANTRPENMEFARFLKAMGAKIEARNRVVTVEGVSRIKGGINFRIMNGWDEAVTYMVATSVTGGEIMIRDMDTRHIKADVKHLKEAGVDIFEWGKNLYLKSQYPLKSFDLFTAPYPGINSDMQPIFTAMALAASGESTITDMRFTDRFSYVDELKKFGADITVYGNCAVVKGGNNLMGAKVDATDLRGGAAEILCGLFAKGETEIRNIYQVERGYENIVSKLKQIGASISYLDERQY
jgi:UDP-N-acetylglucosamine 1-carboxyvinyltransferase